MRRGQFEVVLAALAFAASVPASKLLLQTVPPLALSGVFYLAAGLLCVILSAGSFRRTAGRPERNAPHGVDWLWLSGAVLTGGVMAPLALYTGLRQMSAHVAGLLLNFEAIFTVAFGIVLSGERLGRRGWAGALGVVAGALLLSLPGAGPDPPSGTSWMGAILVLSACAVWGLDNNLTQRVSIRDARAIVAVKGLAGGTASLVLALLLGEAGNWSLKLLSAAAAVGAVSIGLSILLFVRGLRQLGVLQTGTLFALAPGFAAALSWIVLPESPTRWSLLALGLMTAGAVTLSLDRHVHVHSHAPLDHLHEHVHDKHHRHPHTPEELAAAPHAHRHSHEPLAHGHPHVHDIHHRHGH